LDTRFGEAAAQLGGYIKHSSLAVLIVKVLIAIFFSRKARARSLDDAAGWEHYETKAIFPGKIMSTAVTV
jgi:hypothetical protein